MRNGKESSNLGKLYQFDALLKKKKLPKKKAREFAKRVIQMLYALGDRLYSSTQLATTGHYALLLYLQKEVDEVIIQDNADGAISCTSKSPITV